MMPSALRPGARRVDITPILRGKAKNGMPYYRLVRKAPAFTSIPQRIFFVAEYDKQTSHGATMICPEQWYYFAAKPSAQPGAVDFMRIQAQLTHREFGETTGEEMLPNIRYRFMLF